MALNGKIYLANNTSYIFSGDNVSLSIDIENEEKVFVKEICLSFRGEINVKFEDLINKNKNAQVVYFMREFKDQQILLDKHITLQTMDVMNKGKHIYNLLLNIPPDLPESVSRKYGAVKYELALIAFYTKGMEVLCSIPVDVKRYLNVCLHKEYLQPFHTVLRKSFCFGICNTQPLKIILTLLNTTFIPGDIIHYFVKIENFGKLLDLQRLVVILTQTHHYKVAKPKARKKQVHSTLNQIMHIFNEKHHNSRIEGAFPIPQSLVPSSPRTCYLSTSYNLHFIMVFTKFQTDEYITVPITIGSHRDDTEKICDVILCETKLQIEDEKRIECEV